MRRLVHPGNARGFIARVLGCLLFVLLAGWPAVAPFGAGAADAPVEPKGFPYTMRPGDVLVNAPVGVTRLRGPASRPLFSAAVGVVRTTPTIVPQTSLVSPAVGVHRGGAIRAVVPNRLALGVAAQAIRIDGIALTGATAVQIVPPADTTVASFTVNAAGDRIDAVIDVAAVAKPGLRRLRVLDAAGKPVAELAPTAADILLVADLPRIDSVSPSVVARGSANVTLEIRGANLRGLPFRAGAFTEQPQVRVTPPDGVVVGNAAQSNEAGTIVTVPIAVESGAPLSDRVVQVITASGESAAVASPTNTLHIVDGPLRALTPFVSPVLGVRLGGPPPVTGLLVAPPLGVVRGPAITGMTPAFVSPGDRVRLRLTGHQLGAFTTVEFTPAAGIAVVAGSLAASPGEVAVDIDVASNAPLFARRVTLSNGTSRLVAPALLEIRDAMPELTALTPTYVQRDGTSQTLVIQGLHLGQTTGARVLPDAGIVVESYTVQSDNAATLVLRAAPGTALGPRVVRVLGLAEPSTSTSTPGNTFYIVDRQQVLTPFVSPLVGVFRGETPVPSTVRGFRSPLVGLVRGPFARSVTPARIARGAPTRLTVAGVALGAVDRVDVAVIDGLIVRNVTVASDGASVSFDVDVAADAAPGLRRVDLFAGTTPITFVPPHANQFEIDSNLTVGPVANPDAYAATTNSPLVVGIADGVLANDVDSNGGQLYAVLRRLPSSGTLNLSANGSFVYTPNADFSGTDRFEYSAGAGPTVGVATAVTIEVREPNDARDDSYTTPDNQPLVVAANLGLLANDVVTAGPVTIELVSQPTLGQLQVGAAGGFTYTPRGPAGTDRFRYRLLSGPIRSAPAEVAIVVVAVNEAPQATDDVYAVDRGRTLNVAAPGVLANDRDPDGDPMSATLIDAPLVGVLNFNANGSFSYTPPADFVGEASFRYQVRDPAGLTAQAVARINVNQNLAPLPDAYSFNEGEVLFVDAPGLLANDSIIAQGPLRVVLAQPPAFGTVQLANDGSFVYRPDTTDRSGVVTFKYRLEDNAVVSPAVDVRLTIVAVNDPPVVADDRYLSDENAELIVPAPGLLDNDDDNDSTSLAASVLAAPQHGVVTVRPDGSFNYVPEVNYRGTDTFTYTALDDGGASAVGTVTIDVTQPPTATNDVYLVDIDTPLVVADERDGLLVNDFDTPENDDLVVIVGDGPSHGRIEGLDPLEGTFTYVPDAGYSGIDTFTYQVTDGVSESNVAVVTLAVGITSLPRAFPDEYELGEDQELVVPAIDGVLANDTDADTPHANLQAFLVGYDYRGSPLDITLQPDGSFRVRPWANFYGETFFVYQVYDGADVSNAAVVKLKVVPVNDGVDAVDDRYGVLRNTVYEPYPPISMNDRYDGDYPVNFEVVVQPQSGSVEMNAATGHFRYTPNRDFAGTDTFTYRLFQVDTGIGDTAVVTLRTNGPAVASPDAYAATEDSVAQVTPHPLANDADPDGDPIRMSWNTVTDYRYVTLTVADPANPSSTTTLTTSGHFYGNQELTYAITDGVATTYSTLRFTVAPVPDVPVAESDQYLTQRNTTLQISDANQGVLRNDFDPDTRPHAGGPVWAAASGPDLLPITAQLLTSTSHGALTFSQVGTFRYVPDTDYSGIDTFTYRVSDATGRTSQTVTVSIRVNSPAVANDDAYVVNEDTVLNVAPAQGLLVNDTDSDGDTMFAFGASNGCAPCNGRVVIRQDGGFQYTPNANFHGQDEFYYSVRDGVAEFDVGRVVVTVLPVNDAPLPENDTYRTREDEVLIAAEPQGALRNDKEVDGERLIDGEMTVPPQHGNAVFAEDGSFTYTPNVNFNGRDEFKYRVFDQSGLFAEARIEVLVTPVNDLPTARNDDYETSQRDALHVAAAQGLLANDSDVDGPNITASLIGNPQHGQVTLEADGSFVYTPDGFFTGVDQFQYQIDDGLGALAAAAASIRVNAVAPDITIEVEDDYYRFEGPSFATAAPGVLANDRVTGAPALAATLVLAPDRGTVTLAPDGGFSYQAPPGFTGVVGFTYGATAGGVTELAHVTLDVFATANEPPVALGEQFGVLEDRVLDSRSSGSLLANDSDYEGAPLTLELVGSPQHGVLDVQPNGEFTYTPAADYNGPDQFTYRVSDGVRPSNVATASISVFAQNDAPVAQADRYLGSIGQAVVADAAHGLLANDRDVDGDTLVVELVDAPIHGQVVAASDGGFTYQPQPGYVGDDRFRYAASDGAARAVAEATIVIAAAANHPPQAQGESYAVDEDGVLASATAGSLLANDSDPDGDALQVTIVDQPAHGALTLTGADFEYRPAANWSGADAFTYTVGDGQYTAGPVTAAITVRPVNDAPLVGTDLYTVQQGQNLAVTAAAGVLANDSDVENQPLAATVQSNVSHGTLTLQADGAFAYRPNAQFVGRDEFVYRASDGADATTGRAVIDVTAAANQRPIAVGEVFAIAEDSVLDTRSLESLLANDRDPEQQPLTLEIVQPPAQGTLDVLPGGHVVYTPARNAVGEVVIGYSVSDGQLSSAPVELRIVLTPLNDAPEPQADLYTVPAQAATFTVDAAHGVLANDVDPDADTLLVALLQGPSHGTLNLALDGSFVYTPATPRAARDGFIYRVSDPAGIEAQATVQLLLGPQTNDTIFKDGFESTP